MSKLDEILDKFVQQSPSGEVTLTWSAKELRPEIKNDIKDLMTEIIKTTDVLGPPHPQTNIWYKDLIAEVEKL